MKFKKVRPNNLIPRYIREDGKIIIIPYASNSRYEVYDEIGKLIDIMNLLKDAKQKYQ